MIEIVRKIVFYIFPMNAFRQLAEQFDPEHKFRNKFLEENIFVEDFDITDNWLIYVYASLL